MNKTRAKRSLDDSQINQIMVLRTICSQIAAKKGSYEFSSQYPGCLINELAEKSGVKDEKEVLRYLFILEGQKLVSPCPEGDFTSKVWTITKDGFDAVRNLGKLGIQ